MAIFFCLCGLILIIDYRSLTSRKEKKEIIVYTILIVFTVILAMLYYKDFLSESIVKMFAKMINIEV